MGLELVTEARDTKSARTFILDVLTFQTVSDVLPDATFRFLLFLLYQPKQTKIASNVTETRRSKKQHEGPPTRRDTCSIMTEAYQKLKKKKMKKGTTRTCFFTRQSCVSISLLKKKRTEKSNISLRLPEPQHHPACMFNTHAYWAAFVGRKRECWELACFSTMYPMRKAFLEKA